MAQANVKKKVKVYGKEVTEIIEEEGGFYPYYFKGYKLDPYMVAHVYDVKHPALFHAMKKIMCAGGRSGGKTVRRDVEEAIVALERWLEMDDGITTDD